MSIIKKLKNLWKILGWIEIYDDKIFIDIDRNLEINVDGNTLQSVSGLTIQIAEQIHLNPILTSSNVEKMVREIKANQFLLKKEAQEIIPLSLALKARIVK